MPLLRLETDALKRVEDTETLLDALASIVSESIGKPVDYVMVSTVESSVYMSGRLGDSALMEVSSIGGLDKVTISQLASRLTELLSSQLGIPPERVYCTFEDVPGERWAWQGRTFR
jgi:phenylpyruvate tautomerase PptA (4-oxalocrotonate tautomerase family)